MQSCLLKDAGRQSLCSHDPSKPRPYVEKRCTVARCFQWDSMALRPLEDYYTLALRIQVPSEKVLGVGLEGPSTF